MKHTCHATGCDVATPRAMFMCRRHWRMLPGHMKGEVWQAYVQGQEEDMALVTEHYLEVTSRCITYVAARERDDAAPG